MLPFAVGAPGRLPLQDRRTTRDQDEATARGRLGVGRLEKVESVSASPVNVLDDPELASLCREGGKSVQPGAEPGVAIDRPRSAGLRRFREDAESLADDGRSAGAQPARLQPGDRVLVEQTGRQVGDGSERSRIVGSEPPTANRDPRGSALCQLLEEPRLAGPRRGHSEPPFRRPEIARPIERRQQRAELAVPAEGRRPEVAHRRLARADRARAERRAGSDGLALALQLEAELRSQIDRLRDAQRRRLREQHAAGRGGRLQASGGIDRVPGQSADIRTGVGIDDLARRDAHADRDLACFETELGIQPFNGSDNRKPTPGGALGIVVTRRRDAESRHDRIADELLEHAAVAIDGLADR